LQSIEGKVFCKKKQIGRDDIRQEIESGMRLVETNLMSSQHVPDDAWVLG